MAAAAVVLLVVLAVRASLHSWRRWSPRSSGAGRSPAGRSRRGRARVRGIPAATGRL